MLIKYHTSMTIFYQWHFFINFAKKHTGNLVHISHLNFKYPLEIFLKICYNIH